MGISEQLTTISVMEFKLNLVLGLIYLLGTCTCWDSWEREHWSALDQDIDINIDELPYKSEAWFRVKCDGPCRNLNVYAHAPHGDMDLVVVSYNSDMKKKRTLYCNGKTVKTEGEVLDEGSEKRCEQNEWRKYETDELSVMIKPATADISTEGGILLLIDGDNVFSATEECATPWAKGDTVVACESQIEPVTHYFGLGPAKPSLSGQTIIKGYCQDDGCENLSIRLLDFKESWKPKMSVRLSDGRWKDCSTITEIHGVKALTCEGKLKENVESFSVKVVLNVDEKEANEHNLVPKVFVQDAPFSTSHLEHVYIYVPGTNTG